MRHFLSSHQHEERLRADVAGGDCGDGGGPSLMCGRLKWREQMDRSLMRLMLDVDLDGDALVGERHRLRCEHVDKTFGWYEQHGRKEAKKEREAPRFLTFDPYEKTMPGSLRRGPPSPPAPMRKKPFEKPGTPSTPSLPSAPQSPAPPPSPSLSGHATPQKQAVAGNLPPITPCASPARPPPVARTKSGKWAPAPTHTT